MPLVHINILLLRVSVEQYEVNAMMHMYFARFVYFVTLTRRGKRNLNQEEACIKSACSKSVRHLS